MKIIPLTRNKVAFVSDEDYEMLMAYRWYAAKTKNNWYAMHGSHHSGTFFSMHKLILPGTKIVDHIDGNGLNNVRENLRRATARENNRNRIGWRKNKTSKFKGVFRSAGCATWCSQICVDRRRKHLGSFKIEEDAAKAYDVAARKYYGSFARTNKMLGLL